MASIDKRPNSTYRARWREYAGGPQRTRTFRRKIDAEQHLVRVQHDLLSGAYIAPEAARTTVEEFYRVWSARQPWRPKTRAGVATSFEVHILPSFGSRPLGSLRRGDVEAFAAGLDLKASTVRLVLQHLSGLFEAAIADGLASANPLRGAKRPKVDTIPVVPLTADELELLSGAAPPWFAVAVTLGAACGLRQAEAAGLTKDRIDFLRRSLKIDRQLRTLSYGVAEFAPLKTDRSYRTIPLADATLEVLAAHVERFGTGADGLVLHEQGKPLHAPRFVGIWQQTRRRAGLGGARFHDTRHTYASVLLSGGVSVPAAAEYLGDSPAVLLATYAHLLPADHDRARSAVQSAFARRAEDSLRTGDPSGTLD